MELNLKKLSNKSFQWTWHDSAQTIRIEVTLPNLKNLEHSVWGDWGPMYTFRIKESEPIRIKYNESVYQSPQNLLRIESPILAAERDVHPYYLVVEDTRRHIVFRLFIDTNHEFGKIEVVRTHERFTPYAQTTADNLQT